MRPQQLEVMNSPPTQIYRLSEPPSLYFYILVSDVSSERKRAAGGETFQLYIHHKHLEDYTVGLTKGAQVQRSFWRSDVSQNYCNVHILDWEICWSIWWNKLDSFLWSTFIYSTWMLCLFRQQPLHYVLFCETIVGNVAKISEQIWDKIVFLHQCDDVKYLNNIKWDISAFNIQKQEDLYYKVCLEPKQYNWLIMAQIYWYWCICCPVCANMNDSWESF